MAVDYARAQAQALRMLTKFGATQAIRRSAPGAGPAANPGPPTTADHPAVMAEVGYSAFERQNRSILGSDTKVLIAASGLAVEPQPGDLLVISGVGHRVVRSDPFNPAGTVVFYTVQARR